MKKHLNARRHCKSGRVISFPGQKTDSSIKNSQIFNYLPVSIANNLKKEWQTSLKQNKNNHNTVNLQKNFPKKCFAETYSRFLLKALLNVEYQHKDDRLSDYFYQTEVEKFFKSKICMIKDRELLCIYAKQLVMLFKKCKLLQIKKGKIQITNSSLLENNLIQFLFDTFWNKVSWSALFPSMPEFAITLWENRMLLIELLLQYDDYCSIDQLTSDYLIINNFSSHSRILLASFLDFSICNWLSHFNLLLYKENSGEDKILVKLSTAGRIYFLQK